MSDSEWGSDSGASNTEANVASALSMHLVKLMSSRLPSRVTHRRCAPTPVGGASSTRAALSSSSRATGEATRSQTRIDVCSVIRQALSQSQAQCPSANVDDIASRVAAALRQCGEGGDVARAVTRALADPLNEKLRESVLTGRLSPEELVALDELSLLSHTERERLERARQARLDQYSVEYFDRLNNTVTHMFTCPACESRECYAHFRSTDFVKWQGDDETPTLLRCCKCSLSFRHGTGEGSSPEGPSIGALVANEPCDDANSDPTPVSPKQAKVESAPTTPKPPYLNLPRKIVRKTPVSTPTSSLGKLTPVTPPTAASISPSCVSSSSAAAASKRVSLHQRWAVLMHGVLMKERQAHESDRVLELCTRIVEAIPGDIEQMKDTFQTLLFNIKDTKNSELRRRVVEGELLVERLVTMDDRELANPELRKKIEEKIEERSKDTNLSEIRKAMRTSNSTLFKCHACGARDSSWEQRQTRSGDEPMTVIITCNKCNTQWRKY